MPSSRRPYSRPGGVLLSTAESRPGRVVRCGREPRERLRQ